MNFILNDYSITTQFTSLEDFLKSLKQYTLPVLEIFRTNTHVLYKTSNIYSCQPCTNVTLAQLFNITTIPEITKIKSLLCQLLSDPYFDDDIHLNKDDIYHTHCIGDFTGENPNCFSIALEKQFVFFSFEHTSFKDFIILVSKNNAPPQELYNIFNEQNFYKSSFLLTNDIGFSEFLLSQVKNSTINIYFKKLSSGKYIADNTCHLNKTDILEIADDFCSLIDKLNMNDYSSRWTKPVSHENFKYYEFRSSLSDHREFRLYYIVESNSIIFLNSFLKKDQQIPRSIKDYSVSLIKKHNKHII